MNLLAIFFELLLWYAERIRYLKNPNLLFVPHVLLVEDRWILRQNERLRDKIEISQTMGWLHARDVLIKHIFPCNLVGSRKSVHFYWYFDKAWYSLDFSDFRLHMIDHLSLFEVSSWKPFMISVFLTSLTSDEFILKKYSIHEFFEINELVFAILVSKFNNENIKKWNVPT